MTVTIAEWHDRTYVPVASTTRSATATSMASSKPM